MTKEEKELKKELYLESTYREWILDPDSQNVIADIFTDKFQWLTLDFIRENENRIRWDEVCWYVVKDDKLYNEFKQYYINEFNDYYIEKN